MLLVLPKMNKENQICLTLKALKKVVGLGSPGYFFFGLVFVFYCVTEVLAWDSTPNRVGYKIGWFWLTSLICLLVQTTVPVLFITFVTLSTYGRQCRHAPVVIKEQLFKIRQSSKIWSPVWTLFYSPCRERIRNLGLLAPERWISPWSPTAYETLRACGKKAACSTPPATAEVHSR